MSVQTLYTAATGMQSMQTKLDVIANNLANVNTNGFKKDRANFEDLFYDHITLPGNRDAAGNLTPTGTEVGLGVRVSSTQTDYTQGAFISTDRELDLLIEGEGFFQLSDPSGEIVYSRAGNFAVNSNGQVVQGSASIGRPIQPAITIPQDATAIEVSTDGIVSVRQPGSNTLNEVGQIQLATFINPEGLIKLGDGLFAETASSSAPITANPQTNGLGTIRKGMLEASNVEPVQELIDLITTQRSFELNSQTVQAGDQILQLISNLRR
ncbi:flagellar basal-body rod protein FlgG [Bremerella cremea]|uniref:Flagellar basal-body rod protein FlgG n=1 Tax=Bremerella cremea TaxID=1031537 RepID=A0A368KQ61_9BACT|nr:flagellar basal-body rod protein FlgG [Bremerella cremea]RCS47736.1 flagellar basal-body rod protein FlgG [Bremerella cremea]